MGKIEYDRRWFERVPVCGVAALLEYGYLGVIYEMQDVSRGGARLRGPRKPPDTSFEILLHVAGRYLRRRARQVWDGLQQDWDDENNTIGIEFEAVHAGSQIEWPEVDEIEKHEAEAARSWNQPMSLAIHPRTRMIHEM